MMDAQLQRDIGRLEAQVSGLTIALTSLTTKIESLETKIGAVETTLSEVKGGWRMLAALAGISAAIGGLVVKFAPFFLNR